MRMRWCVLVVFVAAATAMRPAAGRPELRPHAIERATRSEAHAIASRPGVPAIGPRRAPAPAPGLELPPVALTAPPALRVPPAPVLARSFRACEPVFAALLVTRSARGPPVG